MERWYSSKEIREITGIKERELKYFVEQNVFTPSKKIYQGKKPYWRYSDEDLEKIQLIMTYKDLGYSMDRITKTVHTEQLDWESAYDDQIKALKKKKESLEKKIAVLEYLKMMEALLDHYYETDKWCLHGKLLSSFLQDKDADTFLGDAVASCINLVEHNKGIFIDGIKKADSEPIQNKLDDIIASYLPLLLECMTDPELHPSDEKWQRLIGKIYEVVTVTSSVFAVKDESGEVINPLDLKMDRGREIVLLVLTLGKYLTLETIVDLLSYKGFCERMCSAAREFNKAHHDPREWKSDRNREEHKKNNCESQEER